MFLTYLKLAAIGLVLAVVVGFMVHYNGLKSDLVLARSNLVTSEANVQKVKDALALEKKNSAQVKKQYRSILRITKSLRSADQEHREVIQDLNDKLNTRANGQSRDLGHLARAKPRLIERIVNRATVNVMRCFELATGAPPREGERNSECKNLTQ